MGIVFRARDLALDRLVALKLILAGTLAEAEDLARFHAEAEAVARLDHPNILRIYEIGHQGSEPFMALELVEGGTLAARLDGRPQPHRAAAALVETLARAIDYAHQRGIVHRDLKPANILLQMDGGGRPNAETASCIDPLSSFRPKIADFGIAKRLGSDATRHTITGAVLGTAQYMAPEQAAGRNQMVGPAADVYALGSILYHLLTGQPPFSGEMSIDILRQVLYEEPLPPRRLRPQISRDLESVCLKCLEKEPGKRYPSAQALAEDLRCYLDGRPVNARRVSPGRRLAKWARRRPVIAGLAAALTVVTLLSAVLVGWQWREAMANATEAKQLAAAEAGARGVAERKTREVELLLLGADVDRAVLFCERGDVAPGLLWLARCLSDAVRLQDNNLERVIRMNLASWRPHLSRRRGMLQHDDWVWDVTFSPDGRFILTGSKDRKVRIWDARTYELSAPTLEHPWPVWSAVFSPDCQTILSGCGSSDGQQGDARLWDSATGRLLVILPVGAQVSHATFDSAGQRILTLGGKAQLWNVPAPGQDPRPPVTLPHTGVVRTALFSPNGEIVLTGGSDGVVQLWDAASGQPRGEPMQHPGPVVTAAFRPDGQVFAAGFALLNAEQKMAGGEVRLWESATGKSFGSPLIQRGPPKSLVFSFDGRMLLTGGIVVPGNGDDLTGEARLYDAQDLTPLGPVLDHPKPVWVVAFSPDARTFLTGAEDRRSRQWLTSTCLQLEAGGFHNGTVRSVAFSPDGHRFVCGSAGDTPQAQVWEAASGHANGPPLYHSSGVNALALSADGKLLATGCTDGTTWIWDRLARKPIRTLKNLRGDVLGVSLSRDGNYVASTTYHGSAQLWHVTTGEPAGEPLSNNLPFPCVSFSPDSKSFVIGHYNPQIGAQRWEAPVGKKLADVAHPGVVLALTFEPKGRWLLTAGQGGVYRWDADDGKLLARELVQGDLVHAVAVSADGKRVLSGGGGRTAQIWETSSGRRLGAPLPHQGTVRTVAFSPDGQLVLTGSHDKTARVWDASTGKPVTPPLQHRDVVTCAAFLPDGKSLVTGSGDQMVQFWEIPAPMRALPERVRGDVERLTGMELGERDNIQPLNSNDRLER